MTVNEGTRAEILVKMKDNTFRLSILQNDGTQALDDLKQYYKTQKFAETLVQGTGELRSINFKPYYYDNRKVLMKFKDISEVLDEGFNADYKCYWNGKKWQGEQDTDKFHKILYKEQDAELAIKRKIGKYSDLLGDI